MHTVTLFSVVDTLPINVLSCTKLIDENVVALPFEL